MMHSNRLEKRRFHSYRIWWWIGFNWWNIYFSKIFHDYFTMQRIFGVPPFMEIPKWLIPWQGEKEVVTSGLGRASQQGLFWSLSFWMFIRGGKKWAVYSPNLLGGAMLSICQCTYTVCKSIYIYIYIYTQCSSVYVGGQLLVFPWLLI